MRLTIADIRESQTMLTHQLRGMVRRLAVKIADATGLWQVLGYRGLDGEREAPTAELFPGIGFMSRPKQGGKPEAIVLHVGGEAGHPVIVATRDKSIQVTLDDDETAIFNSTGAVIKIRKSGDIEVTAAPGKNVLVNDGSGTPEPVVKKSEFDGHTHPLPSLQVPIVGAAGTTPVTAGGTTPLGAGTGGAAAVTGTAVLKAK